VPAPATWKGRYCPPSKPGQYRAYFVTVSAGIGVKSFRYSDTVLSKGLRVKQMLIGLLIKPSLVHLSSDVLFFIGEAVNRRGILRQHRSDGLYFELFTS
jgi:hypothetical protein